jgi:hypothetical protein
VLYLGLLSSGVAYTFWNHGVEALGPSSASSFLFLDPISAMLGGMALLGEDFSAAAACSGAIVLLGVYWVNGGRAGGRFLRLACAGALLIPSAAAAAAKPPKPSQETVRFVETFAAAETSALPPEEVPRFLAVDPESLPEKLRERFLAKRSELLALKRIAEGKKKPPLRRLGVDKPAECRYEKGGEAFCQYLLGFGFEEITEDEEKVLMNRTKCDECELMEESSLTIVVIPPRKKGERPSRRLFMNLNDPFMSVIAAYRKGTGGQTNFFSVGFGGACRQ